MTFILAVVMASGLVFPGTVSRSSGESESRFNLQDNKENVAFRWAFGALVGKSKNLVPITRDTTLASGDEMKMFVELKRDCFVYIIHYSAQGEIGLLFPESLRQFAGDYKVDKNYYVPKGRSWFELDKNIGKETFYLIAASERLLELEALMGEYESAPGEKKPDLAKQILAEIRDVKRKFRTFTTLAERPVTIGGNIRGVDEADKAKRPDVSSLASEISASNFYSKTFTIDHK
ncbi:MAG: DUF4384 domain-containing protein [Bacteroidota bacterium]